MATLDTSLRLAGTFLHVHAWFYMRATKKAPYRGFWGFWGLSADICAHIRAPLEKHLRDGIKRLFLGLNVRQVAVLHIVELQPSPRWGEP